MAATNTMIQSMVPDHIRGRIMSFYTIMLLWMLPFGSMLMGAMAHALGAPAAVRIGAGCAILAGAVFLARVGRFRRAARDMVMAQREGMGAPGR
jgi:MFS family permease